MIPIDEPDWFEEDVVSAIHSRQLAEHGGISGSRDEGMLKSALARPKQLWAYADPNLFDLVAAYAFSLARNPPFLDGNKRIAAVVCETLLDLYGYEINLGQAEKYVQYSTLAAGEISEESFAAWLREHCEKMNY